ncbi:DegV family protein [Oribacterium sp. WCC10]|uniref:DegV family protein n=1 Tax=Oribacterium sp. WCC10 TaxID=1855343 RepID=UPI0008EE673F|nr:DegV family protein [Oribacterium sp. WCC10]SFG39247.1 EDD domain protein, DegV family [Oribacterium sp. WCC10]
MRIGVSTDSGSGITQEEGKALGIRVVPMPFRIDGQEYFEGVNITKEEFYEKLQNDCDVATSQPSPEDVMKVWDELLEECDQVVHIPLTSGLSGSTQTAMMLSHEDKYEGRVFVPDDKGVSVTQRQYCIFALELAEKGYDGQAICDIINRESGSNQIYIGVDTLKYLKKGGRITPVAAAIGTLLHIKPVLGITYGGKLDSYTKVRTTKQVKEAIIKGLKNELETRLGDPEMSNCYVHIAHTENDEQAHAFAEELKAEFPDRLNPEIVIAPLSLLISCHVGPGSLAAAVIERPEELK